jgi:hypothetical protein
MHGGEAKDLAQLIVPADQFGNWLWQIGRKDSFVLRRGTARAHAAAASGR